MKAKDNDQRRRVELGRHIVADSKICGGQPTFKGTRIMVWIVLEQLEEGLTWVRSCGNGVAGSVSRPSRKRLQSPIWWSSTNHSRDSMLVLDENLPLDQQHWLRSRRIRFRVFGVEVARSGTTDENLTDWHLGENSPTSVPWPKR